MSPVSLPYSPTLSCLVLPLLCALYLFVLCSLWTFSGRRLFSNASVTTIQVIHKTNCKPQFLCLLPILFQHFALEATLKQICCILWTKVITVIIWAVSPILCKIKWHATKPLKTKFKNSQHSFIHTTKNGIRPKNSKSQPNALQQARNSGLILIWDQWQYSWLQKHEIDFQLNSVSKK